MKKVLVPTLATKLTQMVSAFQNVRHLPVFVAQNAVAVKLANNDGDGAAREAAGGAVGESAAALFAKGASLMAQKKWAEAVEMLRSAVAKDETLRLRQAYLFEVGGDARPAILC